MVDDSILDYFKGTDKRAQALNDFAKAYGAREPARCPACGMSYQHKPMTGLCYNGCHRLTMAD